jgi:hypothetical protein
VAYEQVSVYQQTAVRCSAASFYEYISLSRRRDNIYRASQVLAQGVPLRVPKLYRALIDYSNAPRSTLYYRTRGRSLIEGEKLKRSPPRVSMWRRTNPKQKNTKKSSFPLSLIFYIKNYYIFEK